MTRKSFLGRGLEATPGKPFGYAFNQERAEIRQHLIERGWLADDPHLEFRITRIQERLWKYKPTLKQRQAAWRARQPQPSGASLGLTREELQRLVDLFTGANDPVTASIATKAAMALRQKETGHG